MNTGKRNIGLTEEQSIDSHSEVESTYDLCPGPARYELTGGLAKFQ